ncbi:MAG: 30S ribosomal protein S15 [Mollicutes bacterium UO1]
MITNKNYQLHEKDTGSTVLQLISLRAEINKEKFHLVKNKKDVPVKRALLKKIAKEKKFFKYLKKNNPDIYDKLKKELK